MLRAILITIISATPMALQAQTDTGSTTRTVIIMDGSGSMWGQIDGVPKLEIARATVAEVLGQIDPARELGLMAYGHRRRGDCTDIELMVPPAPGTAAQILSAVNAMRFQGRTPLSAAVRHAAEALRFTENPAQVILITDGIETCNAAPCALGRELEAAGIAFTAHVVGFGLSTAEGAQIACLAQETGGRYLRADDAAGLADALRQTVLATPTPAGEIEAAAPAPLPEASLEAPDSAPITSRVQITWSGPALDGDYITVVEPDAGDGAWISYVYVEAGKNEVTLPLPAAAGPYVLRYITSEGRAFATALAERPITVTEADFALDAPMTVARGAPFAVNWVGPSGEGDYIDIAVNGEPNARAYIAWRFVADGNPVTIDAPGLPGTYQLRYIVHGATDLAVGLSIPFEVVDAETYLIAPAAVRPGQSVQIEVIGPFGAGDWIDFAPRGNADPNAYISWAYAADEDNGFITLTAPDTPGDYDLRYVIDAVQIGRVVTATQPISVDPNARDPDAAKPDDSAT